MHLPHNFLSPYLVVYFWRGFSSSIFLWIWIGQGWFRYPPNCSTKFGGLLHSANRPFIKFKCEYFAIKFSWSKKWIFHLQFPNYGICRFKIFCFWSETLWFAQDSSHFLAPNRKNEEVFRSSFGFLELGSFSMDCTHTWRSYGYGKAIGI